MTPIIHFSPTWYTTSDGTVPLPAQLTTQQVDAQIIIPGQASVSLWWNHVPTKPGEKLGVIGHFHALTSESAIGVLQTACQQLRKFGCTMALGPMDGNTWRRYRLLTWRGDEPRFALEPDQPDEWVRWWQAAGFVAHEEYYSAMTTHMTSHDERLDRIKTRLQTLGVTIRPIVLEKFDDELARIYQVSAIAFRDNVLYTPIVQAEFVEMYQKAKSLVRPDWCLIAEHNGVPVGFIFIIPDVEQRARGQTVDTAIVKTLAKLPDRAYAGLGKILLERGQQAVHAAGMRRIIHALMHEDNTSRNLGEETQVVRRYSLFACRLP